MNEYLIGQLQELGCTNVAKSQICIHVYIELTEVKKYWDVKFQYDQTLGCPYITSRKNKNGENIIFIPMAVSESFSFNDLQKYFSLIKNNEKVYLAIVDPDSTSVYYQISEGIAPPAKPVATRLQELDRRKYNDNILQRNAKVVAEAALCGLTVDLTAKGVENAGMENYDDSDF